MSEYLNFSKVNTPIRLKQRPLKQFKTACTTPIRSQKGSRCSSYLKSYEENKTVPQRQAITNKLKPNQSQAHKNPLEEDVKMIQQLSSENYEEDWHEDSQELKDYSDEEEDWADLDVEDDFLLDEIDMQRGESGTNQA